MAGNRASERYISFAAPSFSTWWVNILSKSVDHLANPLTAGVQQGKLSQTQFADLASEVPAHYRILEDLREDVEHERNRRDDLTLTVQSHRVDRSDDRPQFAFSLVENDREHRALRDELRLARRDIAGPVSDSGPRPKESFGDS